MDKSRDKFEVVPWAALQQALRAKGIGPKDLLGGAGDVTIKGQKVPALVLGILRGRAGREVTIQCELLGTERQRKLTTAGGVALLNPSEWAMLGQSAELKPSDYQPDTDSAGRIIPVSTSVIARLDEYGRQPHPLLRDDFAYSVRIFVGGWERKPVARGNEMWVPLSKGEVYEIRIENRDDRPVLMRLLVDGLNTLPESPRGAVKGMRVEAVSTTSKKLPPSR